MGNKILIIDDEPDLLADIGAILELKGYDVLLASGGEKGIELAINEKPDLILCDIMMPKVDGFEVIKKVNENSGLTHVPFLFMSARSTKEDIREGMNLGADDYISKPFDLEELLDAVSTRIKKAENTQDVVNKRFDEIREVMSRTLPHEFRTPLNSILGYSNHLIKGYDDIDKETALEMLNAINDDAKRLNRLFENYLTYTQLSTSIEDDQERKKYLSTFIEIPEIIINDIIMMTAHKSDLEVEYDFTEEDFELNIDKRHLTKAVHELVDNAIKFTEDHDKIYVSGSLNEDEGVYQLVIKNSGRAFSHEELENIKAFSQIERDKYEQQGTGMGLAIVKKITELYNSDIKVDHSDGETSVTLSFRYKK